MKDKYLTLIRRELWEHRALWIAPTVAAGLIIVSLLFGQFRLGTEAVHFSTSGIDAHLNAPEAARGAMIAMLGVASFIGGIGGLVVFTYLLDCLFAERKDRSILFWKSLPVSDAETVLSKLVVAMLVVPALVLLLALALQPVLAGIMYLRFEPMRPFLGAGLFGGTLQALGKIGVTWLFSLLWFLPLATYLMLASVAAKRAPLMYATVPPFALWLGEKIVFGADSNVIGRFIGQRMFPWKLHASHLWGVNGAEGSPWLAFADAKLWLGLVAAAGMVYIIIRLRRYRDDT